MSFAKAFKKKGWITEKIAQKLDNVRFVIHDFRLRPKRRLPADELIARLPAVAGAWPDKGEKYPLLFTSCDPLYFALHFRPLLASIEQNSPGTALHLHLYNPTPDQFDELARLQQIYPHVHLSYTWEYQDLPGSEREGQYIVNIRFIRLYSAVRHSQRAIFAIDIDSLIRGPLEQLVVTAGDADVGLILRAHEATKRVLGAAIYAAPTAAGLHFLEALAKHLAIHLAAGIYTDKLDQRYLWKIYISHRDRLKLWAIPKPFSDWSMADDSPVWHGKGGRKELEKFTQERDRLLHLSPQGF